MTITGAADDLAAWERQPMETAKQHHAFDHFLRLGADRSIDKAYRECQRQCRGLQTVHKQRAVPRWRIWSAAWAWSERAAAFDGQQDRIAREKIARDQVDARIRHARIANANLQVMTIPARAVLEIVQDATVMQRLIAEGRESSRGLIRLIHLVVWAGKTIPALVATERLALGMTTDEIVIEAKRDDTIARRIVESPAATALAIQLLDQIAGTDGVEQQP